MRRYQIIMCALGTVEVTAKNKRALVNRMFIDPDTIAIVPDPEDPKKSFMMRVNSSGQSDFIGSLKEVDESKPNNPFDVTDKTLTPYGKSLMDKQLEERRKNDGSL